MYWVTKQNGFGRAYQTWLGVGPDTLLPFYADHGVCLLGNLEPHEVENDARYHLTFNYLRYRAIRSRYSGKKVFRTCHPWIHHRHLSAIEISPNAKGTLIFLPHSIREAKIKYDINSYVSKAKNISPPPYLVIVHPYDLSLWAADGKDFPAGDFHCFGGLYDEDFISNFYDIVRSFSHAISATPGSEVFYCTELGLNHKILDIPMERVPTGMDKGSKGSNAESDKTFLQTDRLVRGVFSAGDIERKKRLASIILSLDLLGKEPPLQIIREVRYTQLKRAAGDIYRAVRRKF